MKSIYFLSILTAIASCNFSGKETEKKTAPPLDTKPVSPVNCYRYANANDTISLKLIHVGQSITGTLVYALKEKDSNKGTIQGSMKGDLLVAEYTFMSEGMTSIRQVAFKLEGDHFIEGYGDIFSKDEKTYFKNLDSLSFNTSMKLAEINCQ